MKGKSTNVVLVFALRQEAKLLHHLLLLITLDVFIYSCLHQAAACLQSRTPNRHLMKMKNEKKKKKKKEKLKET